MSPPTFNSALADQLRLSGVVEDALREEREAAIAEAARLEADNQTLREELQQLIAEIAECNAKPPTRWERLKARFR